MVIFDKLFGRLRTKRQDQPGFAEYPTHRLLVSATCQRRFEPPRPGKEARDSGVWPGLAACARTKVTTFPFAQRAPALTLFTVIIVLANIALPLTNAFVGEFMMFNGVLGSTATKFGVAYVVAGLLTVILGAVYSLRMVQRVFYGETNQLTATGTDISLHVQVVLAIIVVAILVVGIYPKTMLSLTEELSHLILNRMNLK